MVKIRLVLLFGSNQHFTLLQTATCFTCFLLSKMTLLDTVRIIKWCHSVLAAL